MKKFAIILAGGEGRRAGGSTMKQMVEIEGKPMVWWCMKAFMDEDPTTEIILVMHPALFYDWDLLVESLPAEDRLPHTLCCGGKSRAASVENGLRAIAERLAGLSESALAAEEIAVAVHDGARPAVSVEMISRGFASLGPYGVGLVPALPESNSLRKLENEAFPGEGVFTGESRSVPRKDYVIVQTPQVFYFYDILDAYMAMPEGEEFTDDASVAEAAGMKINLYQGDPANIKVTYPIDFRIVPLLLPQTPSATFQE